MENTASMCTAEAVVAAHMRRGRNVGEATGGARAGSDELAKK